MFIALDTETYLIKGSNTPPIVCLSYCAMSKDGWKTGVATGATALDYARRALSDHTTIFHNPSFDLCVLARADASLLPIIFKALEEGRVKDTKIREKLHKIACGGTGDGIVSTEDGGRLPKLSLAGLAYKYYGLDLSADKSAGSVRYNYDELVNVPVKEWSDEAQTYAAQDALITGLVYLAQHTRIDKRELLDEGTQVAADFSLRLMGTEGIPVDQDALDLVHDRLKEHMDQTRSLLEKDGLIVDGKASKAALQEIVREYHVNERLQIPKTNTGAISTAKNALEACSDPRLTRYLEYKRSEKLLSTYVSTVASASLYDGRLRCEYRVLMQTGRTSCKEPNLQNLPRVGGIRDCFVASEGHVLILCDYDAAEMRTLAQAYLDLTGTRSPLLEMYQARPDFDPHAYFAAALMGIDYDEALSRLADGDKEIKAMRQRAKPCNFGFAGGMGARSFLAYAAGYGVELTEEEAVSLRDRWIETYDMQSYFDEADRASQAGKVIVPRSERQRGLPSYTVACNTPFQGMAADGAKRALFHVTKECYSVEDSPLFGCTPLVFVHDEIIIEAPAERASAAAHRLSEVMKREMETVTPDVPASCTSALAERWYKGAEPVYNEQGDLIPWVP